ncbi:pentatricopeptide repeat-containing protein [Tripterygium wilfordii]|uniref:Pentatricopeptide repeat-containing protein n=1 Tax=Tripterygium wilfordii TaxID=458696 RepID=A0A7J7DXS7_TRIWF|nr:pentatricopeptide repeat-containing protein At5g42450, mitochondrial [Tripterygium wilfordii]KAF5750974.1 pentatricopeptide repeat-containing protein [Tripterygium wilfordii]
MKLIVCRFRHSLLIHREACTLACNNLAETPKATHGRHYEEATAKSHARQMFDSMPELNVLSATTLISRSARLQNYDDAIYLFSRMFELNIRPNEFTFGTVIHSSTVLGDLYLGRQFHACAMKMGLHPVVFVGSAVSDMYVKLGSLMEARRSFQDIHNPNVVSYTTLMSGYLKKERFGDALQIFQEMPERNVVSWNAIIGGYSQMGQNEDAVNLFIEMLRQGMTPNESTFSCIFSAAANIAALGIGRSFHGCAIKILGKLDVFSANSLISFYAKCGSMEDSLLVFNKLPDKNIVSWNSVICGCAQNGRGDEAVDLFEKMLVAGIRPNSVTLLGLLWACNHVGLVDKGYSYFNQARLKNPSLLKPEHYACMVDLLSRSARFREAEKFLHDLPFDPGIGFWKALLGGCQIHSNMVLGELAVRKILSLDPEDVSSYVMLSNAHSAAGRWQNVSMIRKEMKDKQMKRVPGCSWIEIRSIIHIFVTADQSHRQKDQIYMVLDLFSEHVRNGENVNF